MYMTVCMFVIVCEYDLSVGFSPLPQRIKNRHNYNNYNRDDIRREVKDRCPFFLSVCRELAVNVWRE